MPAATISRSWYLLFAAVLAIAAPEARVQSQTPRREITDPGVIATDQRVTPAGVQSVFDGRVTGVRFSSPSTLWVVVPGSAFHLAWSDNRVVARGRFDGRSGAQGLAIDPATGRALVTSVGRLRDATQPRLPGSRPPSRANAVAQLHFFAGDASGDSVGPARSSGALGDFMAGAPAIAPRAGSDGRRVAVVPLGANDALAVLDAETGAGIRRVPLGVAPFAAVLSRDGGIAYVSNVGGSQPKAGERSVRQCCDPSAEAVRTDARGIASAGTVSRVDVAAGRVTHTITVGRHATALAWDETRARLYVAGGNADAISVIDSRSNAVVATLLPKSGELRLFTGGANLGDTSVR